MPLENLRLYARTITQLAELREQIDKAVSANNSAGGFSPAAARTELRKPMRSPREGSLRAALHEILLQEAPRALDKKEIVARIAGRRAVAADGKLAAAVGAILNNAHDAAITRLGEGRYVAAGNATR